MWYWILTQMVFIVHVVFAVVSLTLSCNVSHTHSLWLPTSLEKIMVDNVSISFKDIPLHSTYLSCKVCSYVVNLLL